MLKTLLFALTIINTPQPSDQIFIDANLKFPHYIFQEENKTIYFDQTTNAKTEPKNTSLTVKKFKKGDQATLIGTNPYDYWKIKHDGKIYYVTKDNLNEEKPFTWDGPILTPSTGTNIGPSGKETYYNLDMSAIVTSMQNEGYNYKYWIRPDGVKMFGEYVMIAANQTLHPKGSIIPTSLGMAIVCDTGSFAHTNPNQVDIAVNW